MNKQTKSVKSTTINIDGMACSGCANTVQEALNNIDGVSDTEVDLENESASVTYNADTVSISDFKQAVEGAGYDFKGNEMINDRSIQ